MTAPADDARRAFILGRGRRSERGRPQVALELLLDDGRFAVAHDDRLQPGLWIDRADRERAGAIAPVATPTDWRTMRGDPVDWIPLEWPGETRPLQERLTAAGVRCHEGDLPYATRYLIEQGIRTSVRLAGAAVDDASPDGPIVFRNPALTPGDWSPSLSVLSIDIETDPRRDRLLSVALHGCGAGETLLLTPPGALCPDGAVPCADGRELIETFCRRVRELDPDVITGWSVIGFDLAQLVRFARRHGARLELGRLAGETTIRRTRLGRQRSFATVPGRVVLDGLDLVRETQLRLDSYSLESVARHVLGRGKLFAGHDRLDEIVRTFRDDRARFAEYNLLDARLVNEILDRLQLVPLAVERSRLTGMSLDRVGSSIAAFELLYTQALHRRSIVAPALHGADEPEMTAGGGHVLEPRPGLYELVLALDFRSLYPSVIRTFGIDPLRLLPDGHDHADPLVAPNGAAFERAPGILPALLDELAPRRAEAQRRGDGVASAALKILMNSFYGVLGTPACRYADPALANAITGFGREILLWTKDRIEREGLEVLYGDTDSLFVRSGAVDADEARRLGTTLAERVTRALAGHVRETWRVDSVLQLEFERLYLRLVLHGIRRGSGGARKRYAGLIEERGETRVTFTGMEVVRRDWTALARRVQRELYERLFADRPVDAYLREIVDGLRAGRFDDELVYRKSLHKPLERYTAARAPHVVAARRMRRPPRRVVRYVVTTAGPEPAGERSGAALDHEHYVNRQLRPVAEPVLALVGLSFARVIGDDRQLPLF